MVYARLEPRRIVRRREGGGGRAGPCKLMAKSRPAGSGPVGPREQKMQAVPGRSYVENEQSCAGQ